MRYLVTDVDEAIAFYARLGSTVVEQYGPAMAILHRDDLDLWLAGPAASASRPMPDGRQPTPGGWNRVVVTVADLEARVAELAAADVTFRNEVVSGPGGRQILCEGPVGQRRGALRTTVTASAVPPGRIPGARCRGSSRNQRR